LLSKVQKTLKNANDTIKYNWLNLYCKYFLFRKKKSEFKAVDLKKSKKIAIILEQENEIKKWVGFQKFLIEIGVDKKMFNFFILKKEQVRGDKTSHFFSIQNFDWKANFDKKTQNDFFQYHYDVLINFYQKESFLLRLASYYCKNKIAIGFKGIDMKVNDLIFDFDMNNWEVLKKELQQYLKVYGVI